MRMPREQADACIALPIGSVISARTRYRDDEPRTDSWVPCILSVISVSLESTVEDLPRKKFEGPPAKRMTTHRTVPRVAFGATVAHQKWAWGAGIHSTTRACVWAGSGCSARTRPVSRARATRSPRGAAAAKTRGPLISHYIIYIYTPAPTVFTTTTNSNNELPATLSSQRRGRQKLSLRLRAWRRAAKKHAHRTISSHASVLHSLRPRGGCLVWSSHTNLAGVSNSCRTAQNSVEQLRTAAEQPCSKFGSNQSP